MMSSQALKHTPGSPSNLQPNEVQLLLWQPAALCLRMETVIMAASVSLRADILTVTEEDNRGLGPQHTGDHTSRGRGPSKPLYPFSLGETGARSRV